MKTYSIGDKVKIVKPAATSMAFWNSKMDKYIGKEAYITRILWVPNDPSLIPIPECYTLDIDGGKWNWYPNFLKPGSSPRYVVGYRFQEERQYALLPKNYGIADIKDGFWVNNKFEWCVVADQKYWIPPSQIKYVDKVEDLEKSTYSFEESGGQS